jgi:hypothetical protein
MRVNRSRGFFFFFFFTAAGLCFRLKNAAVLKSPNSEPESIYLATRIQMRVNRSRRFFFFFFFFFFFTAAGLCFRLKNAAVLKSPNSEPESIYLATRIQMRVNRSRRFFFFFFFFFYSCGVMLSSEECCSAEIPKF